MTPILSEHIDSVARLWRPIAMCALWLIAGDRVGAQQRIEDRVTCRECELSLEETGRAGDREGFELFNEVNRWIARDSEGSLWVTNYSISDVIQVYDGDGAYEEFNPRGSGPREMAGVEMMTCWGDQLLVYDGGGQFKAPDPLKRSVATLSRNNDIGTRYPRSMVHLAGGIVWIASPSRSRALLGYPIHRVDVRSGEIVGSSGKSVEHYDRTVERHIGRFMAVLDSSRVLAANVYSYELRTYARNGDELRHYVRDAEWFRPQTEDAIDVSIMGVMALGPQRVAVFIHEREKGYRSLWEAPSGRTLDQGWRSIVEVLDLREGEVLAREEFDMAILSSVCPTGEVAALVYDEDMGMDHIRTYRLTFSEGERR